MNCSLHSTSWKKWSTVFNYFH